MGRARARDPRGARHRVADPASILSFDDLLGYPVPQDGRLVYLQTPATVWEAEAVLFDEVSRCRPEHACAATPCLTRPPSRPHRCAVHPPVPSDDVHGRALPHSDDPH